MENLAKLKVRIFRAVDEPETCLRYLIAHRHVLGLFDILGITSNSEGWMTNPDTVVLVAESPIDGELLCGIRVQKAGIHEPLPIETAVGKLDPKTGCLVRMHTLAGAGELCGLWVSRKVAGLGLSFLLTRMAISILNQMGITTMFGICAELTLLMFQGVGFEVEESLGNAGTFCYPRNDMLAYALIMPDAIGLDCAAPADRVIIGSFRASLTGIAESAGAKGAITVEYDLRL